MTLRLREGDGPSSDHGDQKERGGVRTEAGLTPQLQE